MSAPTEWHALESEPVVVVRDGLALPIVTDEQAANRRAALFLADVIEEMTGVKPGVMVLSRGQTCLVNEGLFVGVPTSGPCSNDAFRVVAKDGCVRFTGRADYAVFDWCERELGMRYYGPNGRCVEKRDEILAAAVDYADHPVFEHRLFTGGNDEPWVRFAKAGSTHRGGASVHAPHGWYRDDKLKAAHPEIFETGLTPMLCYGNPETLAYYKERIDRHIAGREKSGGIVDTKRKVVTVSQWDAPIACRCRWCRTLYDYANGGNGFASPVIWGRFLAKLSVWLEERHPEYMISFLPYLDSVRVPGGVRIGGNAEAEVCTMPGLALLKDAKCKVDEENVIRGWAAATGRKVLNWHFSCWPETWTSAPYVFGRTIRRHYADMRDVTCGSFVCGDPRDLRLALSHYVWMKCLWNPDVDVEAIYDGFARRMFGPAAGPMRQLIAVQEACWERPWEDVVCTHRNVFERSYPPADVARMKTLLQEAYEIALLAGDRTAAVRIRDYAGGMTAFFEEADALSGRKGRKVIRLGVTNELVTARSVTCPTPWAKTQVVTRLDGDALEVRVRCAEPAMAKLFADRRVEDFVWGNDNVKVFAAGRKAQVFWPEDCARDADGWSAVARIQLTAEELKKGRVLGNVSRLRVGDWRHPAKTRVPGSRRERSRLGTCFTDPDDDPAAFVEFDLRRQQGAVTQADPFEPPRKRQ